jgi:hypothetical protein
VIGSGTDSPPGEKFPGAYGWRDPGLLVNVHYGPKRYVNLLLKVGTVEQALTALLGPTWSTCLQG